MEENDTLELTLAPVLAESDARTAIDAMNYEAMLRKVRTAPLNDPLFRGEVGKYFHARMKEKRSALPEDVRAKIHGSAGW